MSAIENHPLRYALANELHARPFPNLAAPSFAAYLAIKQPTDAAGRDRALDRAHLIDLLDRHGAQHPKEGATHYFGQVGKHQLKWEQHTEFVTYTIFGSGLGARAFDPAEFDVFPEDWLAKAPGLRITSALIRIELGVDPDDISQKLDDWFVPESLAVSSVVDGSGIMAGDFRIDPAGHMRMACFIDPATDPRRIGRILQRMCEIETYKSMSMLGLARVRDLGPGMGALDRRLTSMMTEMSNVVAKSDETLAALLEMSAELETTIAQSSFRFGATRAYAALVDHRISVLREERWHGRQTFGEFMQRRFEPSMRTVEASEKRLHEMAERAIRAANLLRTRVDVERSAQNQELLASMDKRADLQLRLQKTVEGLSVVAISYYAVNLAAYIAYPIFAPLGFTKGVGTAILTPLVVVFVWAAVRRIRREVE